MCILCVIQRWSHGAATVLPWLVIPLIGLWGLSQMLSPPYRFEVTSSRLACFSVLLLTLFWYELLMPSLSAWRVRRSSRLRNRKKVEALELHRLKKTATRRCRNCYAPYRHQNPAAGGKFMCSCCGHVSKRPVLDLPLPPGLGDSDSGIFKNLFGRGGIVSDNASACPDWLEQGSWEAGFGADDGCIDGESHMQAYFFPYVWMTCLVKSVRLFFQDTSSGEVVLDAKRGVLGKRGEDGVQFQESRADRARRKAEEKKQSRIEKELLEEEERKQREEVARLVDECRRLRDEKVEVESRVIGSCQRETGRKEAEKRRRIKRKENDRASSKSNSDVEEVEKKASGENERKGDSDNTAENERIESQKFGYWLESGHFVKGSSLNSCGRGNGGNRYFDQMRGTIFSSSKAFRAGSFVEKSSPTPSVVKDRPTGLSEHFQVSINRRQVCPTECESTKLSMNVDDKGTNHSGCTVPQQKAAPKSWQQLFTPYPVISAPSNTNVIGRPIAKPQAKAQNSQLPSRSSAPPTYDNPIEFAFSFPFTLPTFSAGSLSNSLVNPAAISHHSKVPHDVFPEESELFEDACYVFNPVSLLGPVSESLDDFQLDMGSGVMLDDARKYCSFITASARLDANKQSPIDSPVSRLRVGDDCLNCPAQFSTSPTAQDVHPFPAGGLNCLNEEGAWKMWESPLLVQGSLGYGACHANWNSCVDRSRSHNDDLSNPVPQKTMASLFKKDYQLVSDTHSPQKILPGSTLESPIPGTNDDLWVRKTFALLLEAGEDQKTLVYASPSRTATNCSFDSPPANCWSKNELVMHGAGECTGSSSVVKPTQMYSLFGHSNDK